MEGRGTDLNLLFYSEELHYCSVWPYLWLYNEKKSYYGTFTTSRPPTLFIRYKKDFQHSTMCSLYTISPINLSQICATNPNINILSQVLEDHIRSQPPVTLLPQPLVYFAVVNTHRCLLLVCMYVKSFPEAMCGPSAFTCINSKKRWRGFYFEAHQRWHHKYIKPSAPTHLFRLHILKSECGHLCTAHDFSMASSSTASSRAKLPRIG